MPSQKEFGERIEKFEINPPHFITNAINNTAAAMVEHAKVQEDHNVLIWFDPFVLPLVQKINERCIEKGANVTYFMRDIRKDARVIPTLSPEKIKEYFIEEENLVNKADVIFLVSGLVYPEVMNDVPQDLLSIYREGRKAIYSKAKKRNVKLVFFKWPTANEALKYNLPVDEYFRFMYENRYSRIDGD